jgi:hypothetical protein
VLATVVALRVDVDVEAEFGSEFGELIDVAFLVASEVEVGALVDLEDVQAADEDVGGELARRHEREVAVEGEDENGVETELLQQAQLDGQGRDEALGGVGPKDADRMRVEGDDQRACAEFMRATNVLAQDVLVCAVYAVEVADGNDSGAEVAGKVVEMAEDEHELEKARLALGFWPLAKAKHKVLRLAPRSAKRSAGARCSLRMTDTLGDGGRACSPRMTECVVALG